MSRAMLERVDAELVRANEHIERQVVRIDILQEHNIRISRKANGLSEEPRKHKSRDNDPVPPEVHDYLEAFDSLEMRANVEDDVHMARVQGTPWPEIIRLIATTEESDVLPSAD